MIREIRYRAKDLVSKKWVYGGYYKHLKRTPYPVGGSAEEDDWQPLIVTSSFSDWNMPKKLKCYEINELTVGQYTGIKDVNGVELYEGDIYHMGDTNIKYEVVWNDSGLIGKQLGTRSYVGLHYWKEKIEIIGNISDNKELL